MSLDFDKSTKDVPSPSVTPPIFSVQSHEDNTIRDVATSVSYLSKKVSNQIDLMSSLLPENHLWLKHYTSSLSFFFMCMIWSLLQLHCWVWLIRCTNDLEYFARLWQKAGVIVVLSMYIVYTLNICVLAEQTHLLLSVSHVLWWLHSCSLLHSALVICLLMLAVSTIFSTILLLQLLPSCCSVQSFGGVAVV